MFMIPIFIVLLPFLAAQLMLPIEGNSVPFNIDGEKSQEGKEPLKALKMIGPEPMVPGQKGAMKTAYFDPKTYSTKDLRDFHRLTIGLNANIRRMEEEMDRLRKKSAQDGAELEHWKQLAANPLKECPKNQWIPLPPLLITLYAMAAIALLMALAFTNLILIKLARKSLGQIGHGQNKEAILLADERV